MIYRVVRRRHWSHSGSSSRSRRTSVYHIANYFLDQNPKSTASIGFRFRITQTPKRIYPDKGVSVGYNGGMKKRRRRRRIRIPAVLWVILLAVCILPFRQFLVAYEYQSAENFFEEALLWASVAGALLVLPLAAFLFWRRMKKKPADRFPSK